MIPLLTAGSLKNWGKLGRVGSPGKDAVFGGFDEVNYRVITSKSSVPEERNPEFQQWQQFPAGVAAQQLGRFQASSCGVRRILDPSVERTC